MGSDCTSELCQAPPIISDKEGEVPIIPIYNEINHPDSSAMKRIHRRRQLTKTSSATSVLSTTSINSSQSLASSSSSKSKYTSSPSSWKHKTPPLPPPLSKSLWEVKANPIQ